METVPPNELAEESIKSILEWLASAHDRTGREEANGLRHRLLTLRATPLPPDQRLKLLDFLYGYASRVTAALFPELHEVTLPIPRRTRQMVRIVQDVLEVLAQDYLESLGDPAGADSVSHPRPPADTLRPAMQALAWHLNISYLAAAPTGIGIWQQLHSAFRISRRLGIDASAPPEGEGRIDRIYLASLLFSVVQPSSFTSAELEFIGHYIDQNLQTVELSAEAPVGQGGIFWIDQDRDAPPYALTRRTPPPETAVLYFACDRLARGAADHLAALEGGRSAAELDLPPFAGTHAGRGVLKRLHNFWGRPARRKFPRRRQSYRADLCTGLDQLWQLLNAPDQSPPALSEWMITNESPDGYAMMHVSGATERLQAGDIVALRSRRATGSADAPWQICMVRWAISENPEHIELGLQVISGRGIPAILAFPRKSEDAPGTPALLLPQAPPLRPSQALVLPTGTVDDRSEKLILVVDQGKVSVLELRATRLEERTSSIEAFTVEADETP